MNVGDRLGRIKARSGTLFHPHSDKWQLKTGRELANNAVRNPHNISPLPVRSGGGNSFLFHVR